MSYENSPACKLVATNCACCGAPLVDAISVETGMGPVCREKHGFYKPDLEVDILAIVAALAVALPEELYVATVKGISTSREAANKLVHRAAIEQRGAVFGYCVSAIAMLGFTTLADRMVKHAKGIRVESKGDTLLVFSPFNPDFVMRAKKIGGKWTPSEKPKKGEKGAWSIPAKRRGELWGVLKATYPEGTPVRGEKGVKVL